MKSMAKKESATEMPQLTKTRVVYPSISISSKVLPDVKDMKMGDTIELMCKCKIKGLREGYDDKKEILCDMDMTACEIEDASDDYKEAKRMKLDRKSYDEYKSKKENRDA